MQAAEVAAVAVAPRRRLLTVNEVACVLGCGRTFVYELIGKGELPVVKLGRLTRVSTEALDEMIARHVEEAPVAVAAWWAR